MIPDPAPRYNVQGVGISALSFRETCALILSRQGNTIPKYVCLATVHGIREARKDPTFQTLLNHSWLTTADGMPLVWLGPPGSERIYGPDLMLAVCDLGRSRGLKHFFFGGKPGVAEELVAVLSTRYPGISIVGFHCPAFRELTEAELGALCAQVNAAQPDVIWVGLGTPKQERFMAEKGRFLSAAVLVGVGAAFDFHTGRVPQAPRWMQRCGLEWLFRLATEPRRLAARYLIGNPLFVLRAAAQKLGLRRYPLN